MATFCLLHSSVQGPSCWDGLVRALEVEGHQAVTPDLGDVSPDALAIAYAKEAAEAIKCDVPPSETSLWVLAHSASGMFLPWIPREIEDLPLCGIIYLAAYVPSPGYSLLGTFHADSSMFNPNWIGADPLDDATASKLLFHDCPNSELSRALSTRRLMVAKAAMSEVFPAGIRCPRTEYIVCAQDRTLTPAWMRRAAQDRLGVTAIEIDSGHCPQTSKPMMLADILSGLADSS